MMKPIIVNDVDIAFGGRTDELLPAWNDIPEEFHKGSNKWHKFANALFFGDAGKNTQIVPKAGIDVHEAARHVKAILGSFNPKHEHKIAGCAFLLSEFYQDVIFD